MESRNQTRLDPSEAGIQVYTSARILMERLGPIQTLLSAAAALVTGKIQDDYNRQTSRYQV